MRLKCLMGALALAAGIPAAHATVILSLGNVPGPNEENVLFNGTGLENGPATTVEGLTNTTAFLVNITGEENLITPANGQARVEAEDGALRYLSIGLDDPEATYEDLIFNLNVAQGGGPPQSGLVDFFVYALDGDGNPEAVQNYLDFVIAQGQNFFTFRVFDDERISRVEFRTSVDLDDVRQIRISGAQLNDDDEPVIPEPASLGLVGLGLAFGGFLRKRRAKK